MHNWDDFYQTQNVDEAWSQLIDCTTSELDQMCPLKEIRIKRKKDPWITNDLIELINDKNYLLKRAKRTDIPEDWETAKNARNFVFVLIRNSKRDYLTDRMTRMNQILPNFGTQFRFSFQTKSPKAKLTWKQTTERLSQSMIFQIMSTNSSLLLVLLSQLKILLTRVNTFLRAPNILRYFGSTWSTKNRFYQKLKE